MADKEREREKLAEIADQLLRKARATPAKRLSPQVAREPATVSVLTTEDMMV